MFQDNEITFIYDIDADDISLQTEAVIGAKQTQLCLLQGMKIILQILFFV